jgi:copper ion binding protein
MTAIIEHATLTAPDISCGHCVATVKDALGALSGVSSVEANDLTKRVEVAYDPSRVSLAQIEAAMDEAGYPVTK